MKAFTKSQKKEIVKLFKEYDERVPFHYEEFLEEKGLIEEEFEVGKWYRDECGERIYCIKSIESNKKYYFGILRNEWKEDFANNSFWNHYMVPATNKEVEEALIKEAKRRIGSGTFICIHAADNAKLSEIKSFDFDGRCLRYNGDFGGGCCFSVEHKWADIVPKKHFYDTPVQEDCYKEMTITQIEKSLGHSVKIVK